MIHLLSKSQHLYRESLRAHQPGMRKTPAEKARHEGQAAALRKLANKLQALRDQGQESISASQYQAILKPEWDRSLKSIHLKLDERLEEEIDLLTSYRNRIAKLGASGVPELAHIDDLLDRAKQLRTQNQ